VAYTHFKAQETQILMLSTNLKVHMWFKDFLFAYKPFCLFKICREALVILQKGPCQHKIFSNKSLKAQIALQTLSKAQITISGPRKITNKSLET
jgi:hypothetical protein